MAEQVTVVGPDGSKRTISRKAFDLVYVGKGFSLDTTVESGADMDLEKLTRTALNEVAARDYGLEDPASYGTKAELLDAIAALGSV